MQTVLLKPLHHREQEVIGIYFKNDAILNLLVRKLPAVKWSQTNKCWYVPLDGFSYSHLSDSLKEKATLDTAVVDDYLKKRKLVKAAATISAKKESSKAIIASPAWKLSNDNLAALERLMEGLKLKAYSSSTIRTYRNEFLQLLQLLKKKPVQELQPEDLRRYFIYCFEKLHLSENTLHSRINAIKFYFEQVLGREKFFWENTKAEETICASKSVKRV